MSLLQAEQSLQVSADEAGMHREMARRYRKIGKLPSEVRADHDWRTRANSFAEVWPWVAEQLSVNPGLEDKTLLEALQRGYTPCLRHRHTTVTESGCSRKTATK
jgi:hypothetical protein